MDNKNLAEKALELSAFSNTTMRFSNSVVLYAMFVLQEELQAQRQQPQDNLANILAISSTIAELSASLRI